MSGPPTLIHVGLHKTGTTWLQERVFQARHGTEVAYCHDVPLIHRHLIVPATDEFDPASAREAFKPVIDLAAARGLLAVISDEALAGRPFHAKYLPEIHAARLAATFPEARILITVREQRRVIYSMYGQYLRYGFTSGLRDFLATAPEMSIHRPVLDRSYFDYVRLSRVFERFFPARQVVVCPLEWMLSRPDAAMGIIFEGTGIRASKVEDRLTGQVVNPAWSDLANEALRHANRFNNQDSRGLSSRPLVRPNSIAHWVNRFTPPSLRRSMKATRMRMIDEAIGDYYEASNSTLSERTGLPLADYGYRISKND